MVCQKPANERASPAKKSDSPQPADTQRPLSHRHALRKKCLQRQSAVLAREGKLAGAAPPATFKREPSRLERLQAHVAEKRAAKAAAAARAEEAVAAAATKVTRPRKTSPGKARNASSDTTNPSLKQNTADPPAVANTQHHHAPPAHTPVSSPAATATARRPKRMKKECKIVRPHSKMDRDAGEAESEPNPTTKRGSHSLDSLPSPLVTTTKERKEACTTDAGAADKCTTHCAASEGDAAAGTACAEDDNVDKESCKPFTETAAAAAAADLAATVLSPPTVTDCVAIVPAASHGPVSTISFAREVHCYVYSLSNGSYGVHFAGDRSTLQVLRAGTQKRRREATMSGHEHGAESIARGTDGDHCHSAFQAKQAKQKSEMDEYVLYANTAHHCFIFSTTHEHHSSYGRPAQTHPDADSTFRDAGTRQAEEASAATSAEPVEHCENVGEVSGLHATVSTLPQPAHATHRHQNRFLLIPLALADKFKVLLWARRWHEHRCANSTFSSPPPLDGMSLRSVTVTATLPHACLWQPRLHLAPGVTAHCTRFGACRMEAEQAEWFIPFVAAAQHPSDETSSEQRGDRVSLLLGNTLRPYPGGSFYGD